MEPAVQHVLRGAAVLAGIIVFVQFLPYGRGHDNPPIHDEPTWDLPQTREAFMAACADCHSNETRWPWYSHVAPASWLVQRDVEQGRAKFNISLGKGGGLAGKAAREVREGDMPPWSYEILHPKAWVVIHDREAFAAGLAATFGEDPE